MIFVTGHQGKMEKKIMRLFNKMRILATYILLVISVLLKIGDAQVTKKVVEKPVYQTGVSGGEVINIKDLQNRIEKLEAAVKVDESIYKGKDITNVADTNISPNWIIIDEKEYAQLKNDIVTLKYQMEIVINFFKQLNTVLGKYTK